MRRPLYWIFVSDEDKPPEGKLYREPAVWAYIIGSSVWGVLCLTIMLPWAGFLYSDPLLMAAAKLVIMVSAFASPTIVLTAREVGKAAQPFPRGVLIVSATVGFFGTFFSGLALWFLLSLVGIHDFFGIPIEQWK